MAPTLWGVRKSLKHNLNITPAIMSRFDLFFVILDECNEVLDYNIARHILDVHRNRDVALRADFTTAQLQQYIKFARTLKPQLTADSAKLLVQLLPLAIAPVPLLFPPHDHLHPAPLSVCAREASLSSSRRS